jgi:hypothetical protein
LREPLVSESGLLTKYGDRFHCADGERTRYATAADRDAGA